MKSTFKKSFAAMTLILLCSHCVSDKTMVEANEANTIEYVKSQGEVLKEYKAEKDTIIIIRSTGKKISKYRVSTKAILRKNPVGRDYYTYLTESKSEYVIDANIKQCFAFDLTVDCQKLANDPDLKPFINAE